MSSRNFRKLAGNTSLPPAPDSDEEYQPLYAQRAGNSKYAGLALSSQSESDHGSAERSEEEVQANVAALPNPVNSKKKKKKKGKGKAQKKQADVDEIERTVQEVNSILGAPPPAPPPQPVKANQEYCVLAVEPKHLNVANELRRLFGPEEADHSRRVRNQPNRALMLRRVLIHPNKDTSVYDFNSTGLSMTKYKEVNNRMYFVFNHDEAYQKMHRGFLKKFHSLGNNLVMLMDEARQNMHIEALLEISDRLFKMEENSIANDIVEIVVTFLQYVAHPLFNLSKNNVRLEYTFMENRPFHVAMLKYVYLLSNKACHRTALEIAKMLLLVDPSDPLAVLSLIDVLALRAREHDWLIETIAYFDRQRDAKFLFNIKYSYGLAHFHVAVKNKRDLEEADKLMKEAILAYPQVLVKILECCNVTTPNFYTHTIFQKEHRQVWSEGVDELFMIYAKMTWPRWNEPTVMSWLLRNAAELCVNYDNNPLVRERAAVWVITRKGLFQTWPLEYLRHVSVLNSMSKLILDAPLTSFNRPTCGWDPLFEKSENRYKYKYTTESPPNVGDSRSPLYRFFHSMIPSFYEPPVDD